MRDGYNREINYLRLALTRACNLKCNYCIPNGLDSFHLEDDLSYDEFVRIVEAGAEIGITKVRLTGGEPLLYPRLIPLIRRIKAIPSIKTVHITTNGILLEQMASDLVLAGIDSINISLDSLDVEKYKRITRGGALKSVLRGINILDILDFDHIKINTVLMRGVNDDEVDILIDWAIQNNRVLRFIEMMPIGVGQRLMESHSLLVDDIMETNPFFKEREPLIDGTSLCFPIEGSAAKIGFITPMRGHFCDRCNKIRISSRGELRQCLMSTKTIPLRDSLMNRDVLIRQMKEAVKGRPSSGKEKGFQNSCMYTIGG